MQKYIIIIPLALFFTITCTNSSDKGSRYSEEQLKSLSLENAIVLSTNKDSMENVNLNAFLKIESFNLESLIKDIHLVSLETNDESLLDVIYKIIVTDSNIYIHDRFKGGGIVIFDNKGKFIKRMPYGQGPGEINRLLDVSYDFEKYELIGYQHPFLLFYTSNGDFIEQKRLPFGFYNFQSVPNGYIFKTLDSQGNEHLEEFKNYTLLVTDKNFKLKSVALPFYFDKINYGGFHYINNNYTLNVTQRFEDTIYQYISGINQLEAKYVLNFDNKKLPNKFLKGSMTEFKNAINNNNYYYYLGEYLETKQHNAFFLMNNSTGLKTIIYRDKGSQKMTGGTHAIYDDKKQIPAIGFPIATFRNYFISCHFPSESDSLLFMSSFLSEKDKKIIKIANEDDNPILVFFELMNF